MEAVEDRGLGREVVGDVAVVALIVHVGWGREPGGQHQFTVKLIGMHVFFQVSLKFDQYNSLIFYIGNWNLLSVIILVQN